MDIEYIDWLIYQLICKIKTLLRRTNMTVIGIGGGAYWNKQEDKHTKMTKKYNGT